MTVNVANVGTGFGRATVTFQGAATQSPCSTPIGPGQSCRPYATRATPIRVAEIQVSAEPGSRFAGWTGAHCSGASSECTIQNDANDPDIEMAVEARFDLIAGS